MSEQSPEEYMSELAEKIVWEGDVRLCQDGDDARVRIVQITVPSKTKDGEARLVVDMPPSLHRRLKIRAIEQGWTIREYVLDLLERDGLVA